MPADLARADHEAMLIVGTFVTAQQNPAVWERFLDRMFDQWASRDATDATSRVSAANQAIAALGRLSAGGGTLPGLDAAQADSDAKPPQAPIFGP